MPRLDIHAAQAKKTLSGIARLLAGARDADAAAASARSLREAAGARDAGFDRVVVELDQQAAEVHGNGAPVKEVARRLATSAADFATAPADVDGAALFDRAIARSYRRGRRAMERAETSLATPDLHRWRKAVKDLWHLLRLARKRLPPSAAPAARRLQHLGELLGSDHDHAMLAERLALSPTGDPALMRQLSVIAKERRALESKAFKLGAILYRDRPKKYARQMRVT